MRIVIDGRFYGLENAGLGRYTINLIQELALQDKKNEYYLLLRKKYFKQLKLSTNWIQVLADFPHYGLQEQIALSRLISSLKPDLVHFLHFNVPVFYRGDYVVTIHDLLMHKQKGLAATTLPAAKYFLKRLGYKTVFARAVKKAKKIIVPSRAVKKELVDYYQINSRKVVVTYEGV
jgi:glycosyltransferase involved in cell wall biosynthesis